MSALAPLLLKGDCLVELARIPDASIDAVVTDPPYGLGFMGKGWDIHTPLDFERFCQAWASECLRILKPGGHMLAFGGSRTWHRLAAGIEDAGFEIRDSIAWLYGSGFPKSMDVSKAIDKAAGHARMSDYVPNMGNEVFGSAMGGGHTTTVEPAVTDAAREWEGWGTALKPAFEPVVVARKPLIGAVAANVLEHGVGALNIDATRIDAKGAKLDGGRISTKTEGWDRPWKHDPEAVAATKARSADAVAKAETLGRWPANVILDESQAAALDAQSGTTTSKRSPRGEGKDATGIYGAYGTPGDTTRGHSDAGGASRFFYVAKAPKSERPIVDGAAHPTVKPLALMRYLIRLVTPPGGCVVDPFAGSGTTLEAAYLEGMESIGVEMTPEYWPLIAARIERVTR